MIWSIVTVNLNSVGFAFTESQLFWLVAIPNLVGATLRLPYTFAVPRFGGRNWTIVSALLLVIPCSGLAWAVSNPDTSFGDDALRRGDSPASEAATSPRR